MLKINNLTATVDDGQKTILEALSLEVPAGEVHAIMGPNGAGKSTLSYVLTGREGYDVSGGTVELNGKDLLDMDPEERATEGVFLSFQYPLEIPGVPTMTFLKTALNAQRKARGEEEMKAPEFLKKSKAPAQCRFFRRREEAHGNFPNDDVGTKLYRDGRNRLRPRCGCLAHCGRWCE